MADQRKAILCIDDEAIILLALKHEMLNNFRGEYQIETATDPLEALDRIERLIASGVQVVVLLSDWLMPSLKGDILINEVKQRHPDIHCILVSGQADARNVVSSGLDSLLDAFVEKPWRAADLVSIVRSCISGDRAAAQPCRAQGGGQP